MGCGFSHRVEPNTIGEPGSELVVNGNGGNSFVGNGLANSTLNATASAVPPAKGSPLSFIVPIRDKEDPKEVSLIRRHPPVRLRRLEEEQQVHRAKLTLDELERRQAEAEERRRKILDSRVQSAQHFTRKVQHATETTRSGTPSPSTNVDSQDKSVPYIENLEVDRNKLHPEEVSTAPAFG